MSPSLCAARDNVRQYILIHENGWASDECGEWVEMAMTKNKDDCARQSREAGLPGFAFGPDEAFGECSGETILVTQAYFNKYVLDPKNGTRMRKNERLSTKMCVGVQSLFQQLCHQSQFNNGQLGNSQKLVWCLLH